MAVVSHVSCIQCVDSYGGPGIVLHTCAPSWTLQVIPSLSCVSAMMKVYGFPLLLPGCMLTKRSNTNFAQGA